MRVLLSLCLDIVDTVVVLYLYLVKLLLSLSHVFVVLSVVVNNDEYNIILVKGESRIRGWGDEWGKGFEALKASRSEASKASDGRVWGNSVLSSTD